MYRKTFFLVMVFALMMGLFSLAVLAAPPLQGEAYTVQKDDCLWKIAEKYLGNGAAYPAIVDATNKKAAEDDTFATIINPRLIYPGWKLWIIPPTPRPRVTITLDRLPCDIEDDTSKIVTCKFQEGVTETVSFEPIPVTNGQPLQLYVAGTETERIHFSLEIEREDYPPPSVGDAFTLTVTAIPTETIAANLGDYPEVDRLTEDGRLIIPADSTEYVAANPYAFSVTGIDPFANPVTASISIDCPQSIPEGSWQEQEHGVMIFHEGIGASSREEGTERFAAELIEERGFLRVRNRDPITRCCRMHGD